MTIFDEVDIIDQLALALACKHLLQDFTLVSLDISKLIREEPDVGTVLALLCRLRPTTEDWKLCMGCFKYRPTTESYWKAKSDRDNWARAKENNQEDIMGLIHGWKQYRSNMFCPECVAKIFLLNARRLE